ncbi:MAG: pyrimidine/purine nucleoside phosphorylase [Bacteroidales bacterium]|nr:pyrimidine/purine nucleoside phosphorylase [Bacteroidales bacterium]
MVKVNEYFDGKVKSLAMVCENGLATVGVMEPGVYEFGTTSEEIMQIIEGEMNVTLQENTKQTFIKGQSFKVPAHTKFQVEVTRDTAYICYYK